MKKTDKNSYFESSFCAKGIILQMLEELNQS
jgi:hypothetical protein